MSATSNDRVVFDACRSLPGSKAIWREQMQTSIYCWGLSVDLTDFMHPVFDLKADHWNMRDDKTRYERVMDSFTFHGRDILDNEKSSLRFFAKTMAPETAIRERIEDWTLLGGANFYPAVILRALIEQDEVERYMAWNAWDEPWRQPFLPRLTSPVKV